MNIKNAVTVLIADDHPIFRLGLCEIIQKNPRFQIIGEASNGEEALEQLACLKPEIAIIDIDMPRLNGLKTIRAIRELPFSVKVIVLTMYGEEEIYDAAMDLGVKAYVVKENAVTELTTALEKVDRDENFVSSSMFEVGKRRSERVRDMLISKPQIKSLTPAERRILRLIGEDLTSKEIAERLALSYRTVENHRHHITQKLNLNGTHSLLRFAFDNSAYL